MTPTRRSRRRDATPTPREIQKTKHEAAGPFEMQRPVASLPLSGGQKTKLRAAGFGNTEDIKEVSLAELSKGMFLINEHPTSTIYISTSLDSLELSISTSEALEILNVVNAHSSSGAHPAGDMGVTYPLPDSGHGLSALELLKAEQEQPFIVTFSSKVDKMLGGGIAAGKITEFCGAPGIGKTQLR